MTNKSLPRTASRTREIAVVIVNYRVPQMVRRCLGSLTNEREMLPELRAVVVDGGSADGSGEQLVRLVSGAEYRDWVSFLALPVNGGFGWANNEAMCRLMCAPEPASFLFLLNPDAEIEPGAAKNLLHFLDGHPEFAAAGSQLVESNGNLVASGFRFPTLRDEISRGARTRVIDKLLGVSPLRISTHTPTEVDWVTGASVMFRVDALREVGLFDEGFFLYHEEVELMWRLRRAGWGIAVEPRSRVRHVGGGATGMHDRDADASLLPRRPQYWFRSRTRYLTLTRGRSFAVIAYFAWLLGYLIWFGRRRLGLAPDGPPIDHILRDHLINSFPRRRDATPAIRTCDTPLGSRPAWMERGAW